MYYSPFSYKITPEGPLKEGAFIPIPEFCKSHYDSKQCKAHYLKLFSCNDSFLKCPYGFGSEIIKVGNECVALTCLNIEKVTNRKLSSILKTKDFSPRLTTERYASILSSFKENLSENASSNEKILQLERNHENIMNRKDLLENTLHEIRKLNNQLKSSVELFTNEYSKDKLNFDKINSLCTDIYSIANLLTIRFDTYDLEVNPELNMNAITMEIPIFKKIEKVYKCLGARIQSKRLKVRLEGNTYKTYRSSSILEIALFIIIDNAVKYALEGTDIKIKFREEGTKLIVSFYNYGIRPEPKELQHLTERGVRSQKIIDSNKFEGRGIGLYLLKLICDNLGVKLKIIIGNENMYSDGYRYSPFIIELTFKDMHDVIP